MGGEHCFFTIPGIKFVGPQPCTNHMYIEYPFLAPQAEWFLSSVISRSIKKNILSLRPLRLERLKGTGGETFLLTIPGKLREMLQPKIIPAIYKTPTQRRRLSDFHLPASLPRSSGRWYWGQR